MTVLRPALPLLVATLLAATHAAALDLTGTWESAKGLRCKIRSSADSGFSEGDGNLSTLLITQAGENLYVLVNPGDGAYENQFKGIALTHPSKPEKGYAVASPCAIDGKYYAGTLFLPKAAADAERGKLSVVFHGTRFSTVAECKGVYERASAADPGVPAACP
jgi:hypothetical protein